MSTKGLPSSISFFYGALLVIVLNPANVSSTLCESRCENAVPHLRRLKTLWHHLSKREDGEDISFTHFIQSLIYASRRNSKLSPLKKDLVLMVFEYKDCVKACEHQHSKRSGGRQRNVQHLVQWPSSHLCHMHYELTKFYCIYERCARCNCILITSWKKPFTVVIFGLGLVCKFGPFLVEDHLQSMFREFTATLNVDGEDDVGMEHYDLTAIVSGFSIGFISLGLGSSTMAGLGIMAAKIDVFLICLTYCSFVGLLILGQIGLVMILSIQRGLIDTTLKPLLLGSLQTGYDGYNGTDSLTQTWNLFMVTMKCCGVEDYMDFNKATVWNRRLFQEGWWFNLTTPIPCCKLDVKPPGDYSCAVNPSRVSSNYQTGCYEAVWTMVGQYKIFIIVAWSALFLLQLTLLFSALVRTKTLYKNSKKHSENAKSRDTESPKPQDPRDNYKSIAELINSTAGISSLTSHSGIYPDIRTLMNQRLSGSLYRNANMNGNTGRPSMSFVTNNGHSMSALNHLLQQYYMQGRFTPQTGLLNPFNIFTPAFMNPYSQTGVVDGPYDDNVGRVVCRSSSMNPFFVQMPASNPSLMRLMSQCSLQGLPACIQEGSPSSLRRGSELNTCIRRGSDTGTCLGHGIDTGTSLSRGMDTGTSVPCGTETGTSLPNINEANQCGCDVKNDD